MAVGFLGLNGAQERFNVLVFHAVDLKVVFGAVLFEYGEETTVRGELYLRIVGVHYRYGPYILQRPSLQLNEVYGQHVLLVVLVGVKFLEVRFLRLSLPYLIVPNLHVLVLWHAVLYELKDVVLVKRADFALDNVLSGHLHFHTIVLPEHLFVRRLIAGSRIVHALDRAQ